MAALGDSMTLAYATNGQTINSWSTGTNPRVRSHYLRILAANPASKGRAVILAQPGAGFAAMAQQARKAIAKRVEYVTIWGGEDSCGNDNLAPFEGDVDQLLGILSRGQPQPLVFLASIRNLGAVYRALRSHRATVLRYFPYGVRVCNIVLGKTAKLDSPPSHIAAATSSAQELNAALARACSRDENCRFDGGAVFGMPIAFGDIAPDFVHLSVAGQRKLAQVTWKATFPFGR